MFVAIINVHNVDGVESQSPAASVIGKVVSSQIALKATSDTLCPIYDVASNK